MKVLILFILLASTYAKDNANTEDNNTIFTNFIMGITGLSCLDSNSNFNGKLDAIYSNIQNL